MCRAPQWRPSLIALKGGDNTGTITIYGPEYARQFMVRKPSPGGIDMDRCTYQGTGFWVRPEVDRYSIPPEQVKAALDKLQERYPLGGVGEYEILLLDGVACPEGDPVWPANGIAFAGYISLSGIPGLPLEDLSSHELTHAFARKLVDGAELKGLRDILGDIYGVDGSDWWSERPAERMAEYVSAALWGTDLAPVDDRMPPITDELLARVREWALASLENAEPAGIVIWRPETVITMRIGSTAYTVDGETRIMDVAPLIRESRTFLPTRYVAEALGAVVYWDEATRQVTVAKDSMLIRLTVGSRWAWVGVVPTFLDAAPFIEQDRTFTPVRFIAEALGATVDWDQQTRTVTISMPN